MRIPPSCSMLFVVSRGLARLSIHTCLLLGLVCTLPTALPAAESSAASEQKANPAPIAQATPTQYTDQNAELMLAPQDPATLASPGRAYALIFLSTKCPCSRSHEPGLRALRARFPQVDFFGVHSNIDETVQEASAHFSGAQLGFPVLQDASAGVATRLGALKTPHVYLYDQKHQLFYTGGIDNSNDAAQATEFYLKQAIETLLAGKQLAASEARRRTLGCLIPR